MKGNKTLLILTSFLLISCDTENSKWVNDPEKFKVEEFEDERKDFTCTSYKIWISPETLNDTSHELVYSYNLGKKSVWVNYALIDDDLYLNDYLYAHDNEFMTSLGAYSSFIFYEQRYQLERTYYDESEFPYATTIYFHCLPLIVENINPS